MCPCYLQEVVKQAKELEAILNDLVAFKMPHRAARAVIHVKEEVNEETKPEMAAPSRQLTCTMCGRGYSNGECRQLGRQVDFAPLLGTVPTWEG